jgi:hypothetical protein
MAVNKPVADNVRKGAVKKKMAGAKTWTKRDTASSSPSRRAGRKRAPGSSRASAARRSDKGSQGVKGEKSQGGLDRGRQRASEGHGGGGRVGRAGGCCLQAVARFSPQPGSKARDPVSVCPRGPAEIFGRLVE